MPATAFPAVCKLPVLPRPGMLKGLDVAGGPPCKPVTWSRVLICASGWLHTTALCFAHFVSLLLSPARMHLTNLTAIAESWDTCACTRSQKVSLLLLVPQLPVCSAISAESSLTACATLGAIMPSWLLVLKPAQQVVNQDSKILQMDMC